jgi:hypothetical protein
VSKSQIKKWESFKTNLESGIAYYQKLGTEKHFGNTFQKELLKYDLDLKLLQIPVLA